MPKKYFFGVKVGITPGVYESWEECKAQILGVTNARWKRFGTCEEAMQYCFESSLKVDNVKPEEIKCCGLKRPIDIDVIPDEKPEPLYSHIDTSPDRNRHDPKRFRKDAVNSPSFKTVQSSADAKISMRALLGLSFTDSHTIPSSSTPASSPQCKIPNLKSVLERNDISAINCIDKVEQEDLTLQPITTNVDIKTVSNDVSIVDISDFSITVKNDGKKPKLKEQTLRQKVLPKHSLTTEFDSSDNDLVEIIENPRKEFQINQSTSEDFLRAGKTEEEIAVGIFWDIENVRMPRGLNPAIFITKIREKFVDESPEFCEKHFYVVCDVKDWPPILMKQLFEFHVRIVHVPRLKANSSDNVLRDLMHEFVGYNKFARLVLISGDSDFSHDIHNFRRNKKCDCILIHNQVAKESMLRSANAAYLYTDLIKQELIDHQRDIADQGNNFHNQQNVGRQYGQKYENHFSVPPKEKFQGNKVNKHGRKFKNQGRFYNHEFSEQQATINPDQNIAGGSGVNGDLPDFIPVNISSNALSKSFYEKKRKQMRKKPVNKRKSLLKSNMTKTKKRY